MKVAVPLLEKAMKSGMAFLKIHSHPGGFASFSDADNHSDLQLFQALKPWTGDSTPNGSLVMLPNGAMFGRVSDHDRMAPLSMIAVAGDQPCFFGVSRSEMREQEIRTAQAFGEGTVSVLRRLRIGVVGCSGTGSWVCELLGRNSVGHLVLVDPEFIETKNLNRIPNATSQDALTEARKVEVQKKAIERMGFGTSVETFDRDLLNPGVIHALAGCDILFGCMDSHDGRDILNRIAVFYNIPYFDLGVALVADGNGGITHISGRVDYLQPDGSSLLSRGHIKPETIDAQSCKRHDPLAYSDRRDEGYISSAEVESPAVASVNSFYASLAVNDFLARLHGYREDYSYSELCVCLVHTYTQLIEHSEACSLLAKRAGRGDCVPLLDLPQLSGDA